MDASEFSAMVGGTPAAALAKFFEVDQRTVRRWKAGEVPIPGAVARLARLRYGQDAAALLGDDWEGFRFGVDGQLYVPGWRGGFDAGSIKAMFFRTQLVRHHEATIRQLEKRVQGLEQDVIAANEAAVKYRRLVSHEARLGLMLERISG